MLNLFSLGGYRKDLMDVYILHIHYGTLLPPDDPNRNAATSKIDYLVNYVRDKVDIE